MNITRPAWLTGLAAILAAAALAGCGSQPGQPAAPGTPSPATSGPASPPIPAPSTLTPSSPATAVPAERVVSFKVTYPWRWPSGGSHPAVIRHTYPVPPVPQLIAVRVGHHPATAGERAFDRMSFTFTTAFPSYEFRFVSQLVHDGSGKPIPMASSETPLRVIFREAQAHTGSGAPSVLTQPGAHLGLPRMTSWVQAGDFEGVLTYGIGITRPVAQSNPQFPVRSLEMEKVTAQGRHLYVVAIDVDAS